MEYRGQGTIELRSNIKLEKGLLSTTKVTIGMNIGMSYVLVF